jgi:hypothetical protein
MTTFNITPTNPTGTVHKRQTGLWGQLLASAEIERKLARVEPLFKELHGRGLNRTAFFGKCREFAREGKADVGGYLQYMTQDVAGIVLGEMHRQIGVEVRRNRILKNDILKRSSVTIEVGGHTFNSADFAKKKGGMMPVNGFAKEGTKTHKLYMAMANREYPVTRKTLMKESGIENNQHFYVTIRDLRQKGFNIEVIRSGYRSIAPKYQLVS